MAVTKVNIQGVDGVTATASEINILDGVTATSSEINILDGVTATAAEINILDGVTATTAEINYVDGVTSNIQTQLDGKQASGSYLTGNQTITLSGDASGSGTTSIVVTVADDSHNHIISNVDGLQTALDAKLDSSSYTATDVLTKIKTVDGAGSGLDADTLDGISSASFLRSDTADTMTANLNIGNGSYNFGIGTENATANSSVGHSATYNQGIFWHSSNSDYAIYRTAGDWNSPNYQQLKLDWPTGIILDGGSNYGLSGVKVEGNLTVTGVMSGTATSARYADLAERYEADAEYAPGTVLVFGGEKEVTQSTTKMDRRKAGIVSTNPAHLMNAEAGDDSTHPAVALQGRVPCKVVGEVRKGDLMITSSVPGCAEAWREEGDPRMGSVIGKSLVNKTTTEQELIEVACGVI